MYHFFVKPENIADGTAVITGGDVNHIKNVLRMKIGEKIVVGDGNGADYCCEIISIGTDSVTAAILGGQLESHELPSKLILFQGLPKADKMELIIQKAVELGAMEIVPVEMSRCVVKLDEKKKKNKTERWQSIAQSAAKQSGRSVMPTVSAPLSFKEALEKAKELDLVIVPYECADGTYEFVKALSEIKGGMSVGIFIGPEGGYEENEIEAAKAIGGRIVSLGKRILRTETAGIAALSICMFHIESNVKDC